MTKSTMLKDFNALLPKRVFGLFNLSTSEGFRHVVITTQRFFFWMYSHTAFALTFSVSTVN